MYLAKIQKVPIVETSSLENVNVAQAFFSLVRIFNRQVGLSYHFVRKLLTTYTAPTQPLLTAPTQPLNGPFTTPTQYTAPTQSLLKAPQNPYTVHSPYTVPTQGPTEPLC